MKPFKTTGGVKERRKSALERLEAQLKRGAKTPKGSYGAFDEALSDSDISRIKKEISILKERI